MSRNFTGKVAVITGAARGIGAGVAAAFVARGGKVALLGLEPELLAAHVADLGESAAWWEADVRDLDALTTAVDAAANHFGHIDFVLANAGIASYGTVRQLTEETFEKVIDVNLTGVFRTLKAATPHLEKSGGYALAISSQAAFAAMPGLAPYNAAKAGVEMLAIAYRGEVAHLGIGVGVCHPSWVDTDIVRAADDDLPTFRAVRAKLPYPSNSTASLEECVTAIIAGFAQRKSKVYVPRAVVLSNLAKPILNSRIGYELTKRVVGKHVPSLERDVDQLGGRQTHPHTPA